LVGARGLVGFWCGEERFEGVLEEGEEKEARR
jgi:peroxin-4